MEYMPALDEKNIKQRTGQVKDSYNRHYFFNQCAPVNRIKEKVEKPELHYRNHIIQEHIAMVSPGYHQPGIFAHNLCQKKQREELQVKGCIFIQVIRKAGGEAYQYKDNVGHNRVL
jgi:hypothetical protein